MARDITRDEARDLIVEAAIGVLDQAEYQADMPHAAIISRRLMTKLRRARAFYDDSTPDSEGGWRRFADALEKIDFEIPAPNPYTPRLVTLANAMRERGYPPPHSPPTE